MNWLDIVIICLVGAGFLKGWADGFIRQIVALLALLAAIYLCSKVAVFIREYILQTGWFPENSVTIISYVVAFVCILMIVTLVGGWIHKVMEATPLSLANHLAGAVFGTVIALFLVSLTLNLLEGVDRRSVILTQQTKVESRLYDYVKEAVPAIYPADLFVRKKD
ncbi:CvpA family protein [Tannerella sp.]|uniref:CvpA family protein n=1 Tax=Tannerella sp. TaxID=2382127 RepID=UPI0026DBD57E|nr:CvpA family protein [Tannerella sp.]MDO4704261.1 CvpA family protein [Tannerella sp.]